MALSPKKEAELLHLLELTEQEKIFTPQPGPQEMFLNCTADIALYGGAAGGGKTYALLLENMKDTDNPKFGSVIFRRSMAQITTEGGLWDNTMDLYPRKGAMPKLTPRPTMLFPSGAKVAFAHLQYDETVLDWQGAQIPLICFDELTHFTRKQFFYMLSRNRSMSGAKSRIRATTNPDADSWVGDFIEWWIDDKGYPIPERSGVIRYFVVVSDEVLWADSAQELVNSYGIKIEHVKSFTFIASSIYDNRILLEKDPGYLANLNALSTVEKGRLLQGNWKIKPSAGMYFKRDQAQLVAVPPSRIVKVCRAWDLAATIPTPENPSPDATAGVMIGKLADGRFIVLDVDHARLIASGVRTKIKNVAVADKNDYGNVKIRLPQDPGQAGKEQAQSYVTHLAGYSVKTQRVTGDKITRAEPFSSQWQAGNVLVLARPWNDAYFTELESFPTGAHDDMVDASSDAFTEIAEDNRVYEIQEANLYDDVNGPDIIGLWYKRYFTIGYSTNNPFAVLEIVEQNGFYYVEDEFYHDPQIEQQKDDSEYVDDIKQFIDNRRYMSVIMPDIPSLRSFARKSGIRTKDADEDLLDGIRMISILLRTGKLKINRKCINLLSEFTGYVWDNNKKPVNMYNYGLNGLRYFCKTIVKRM
jgi:predicted phage terminase large subunit-like protein